MPAQVKHRELIRRGRVFDITLEKVTLPNGVTIELDIIRHPGASAIVAIDDNENILMLQQYRHAVGHTLWEIPAGTLEKDEAPLTCARRELIEETGFSAKTWDYLGATTPVPGYSDEKIHLFLARDLCNAEQSLDPDEIVQVRKVPFKQVVQMIAQGQIQDAKTSAGLFLAIHKLGRTL